MQASKQTHRSQSVQWKLFFTLICFTLMLLSIIWVVQIRLLGFFYEQEKREEMLTLSHNIRTSIGRGDVDEMIVGIAKDNATCVRLFLVQGNALIEIRSADVVNGCFVHAMPAETVLKLREEAVAMGGSCTKHLGTHSATDQSEKERLPWMYGNKQQEMVFASIFAEGGQEYFLLMDSELSPVSAVVRTLQRQFLWAVNGMMALALLLTFALSHVITRPIRKLTEKAGQLAKGNYDIEFNGKGYREAEELAGALNYAASEIGRIDNLQKELIANVSHDLRTPLTMIRGYSEMMRDIPGENTAENIQVVIDETTRLSDLVNDLMDLSKLHAGTMKPDFADFDLTQMLQEALQRYEELLRPKGYRLEYRLAPEEVFVRADRTMLLQVLYNLVNNAANYTGEDRLITVTEELCGDRVRVSVRDTGDGIAPEDLKQIWDRYYRVDRVHKRAVMGTGLGLSIVKGVLEKHAALYGVESALGVGSVFWFELPTESERDAEKDT